MGPRLRCVSLWLAIACAAGTAATETALGAGTKEVRCEGTRATLVGTQERDRLRATRGRDVIVALGGADSITRIGANGEPDCERLESVEH